jgi:hypothetical protein
MRLERIVFIGLCLVLSIGLIFVHMAICQQTKPGESTEAVGGTQKPAVSPEGKASTPSAKVPEQPKPESKPSAPSTVPPTPERSATPGKLPGKFVPSEGC